jgi:hypothetical protein
MEPCVNLQPSCSRIALVAASELARKRLKTGVGKLMRLEVPLGYKSCFADRTLEGPFACVSAHVGFQVTRFREFLETTLVRAKQYLLFILRPRNFLYII